MLSSPTTDLLCRFCGEDLYKLDPLAQRDAARGWTVLCSVECLGAWAKED